MSEKSKQLSKKKNSSVRKSIKAHILAVALVMVVTTPIMAENSLSLFSHTRPTAVTVKADTLKAPTSIKVANDRVGETDVTWIASASAYATGYKVSRSLVAAGPWTTLGSVTGRATVKYIDKTSAGKSYFYKVETIYKNWITPGISIVAPPAVGRTFFDSFDGTAGNLDGKTTADGKSSWLVWSGTMTTADVNPRGLPDVPNGMGAYGTLGSPTTAPSPGNGDVAVVRSPVNDAWVYAEDFDGYERVILRAKDPSNYIYAGGATGKNANGDTTLIPFSFEIAEIKNGFKTVLATNVSADGTIPTAKEAKDKNFRVEIKGSSIKAYIDATRGNTTSGTLLLSATSTFQQTDPLATYFGIGFTRGGMGINDFTFQAY